MSPAAFADVVVSKIKDSHFKSSGISDAKCPTRRRRWLTSPVRGKDKRNFKSLYDSRGGIWCGILVFSWQALGPENPKPCSQFNHYEPIIGSPSITASRFSRLKIWTMKVKQAYTLATSNLKEMFLFVQIVDIRERE
jgi:hypothetical protein